MSCTIRFGIVWLALLLACGSDDATESGAGGRRGGRAGASGTGAVAGASGRGGAVSSGGAAGQAAGGQQAAGGAVAGNAGTGANGGSATAGGSGGGGKANGGASGAAGTAAGGTTGGSPGKSSGGKGGPGPGTHALTFSRGAYSLQVPSNTAAPLPLAILLHGQGDTGKNFLQGWLAGGFGSDLLLAAPDDNHDDVPAILLDHVAGQHDVDLSRVYVVGHSQGGAYAAFLLFDPSVADRFAGVLLNSSGLAENPAGIPKATAKSPAVAICIDAKDPNNTGSLDGSTDFKIMESFATSMTTKGYATKLTLHAKGHTLPSPELVESFAWLRTHTK